MGYRWITIFTAVMPLVGCGADPGSDAESIPSMQNNQYPTWAVAGKENHPINGVNWYQAVEYCEWKGKRLPSEAEWEYAVRGDDGRMYPWGNDAPTCNHVVAGGCNNPPGTAAVGSKPAGASAFGALDMHGNVMEWCADFYQADYYYISPDVDPQGPVNGTTRVFRGPPSFVIGVGNWARATYRTGTMPLETSQGIGFRCAQDPT
jgi:formylglycine-generating enzyme required for sulfatase activity